MSDVQVVARGADLLVKILAVGAFISGLISGVFLNYHILMLGVIVLLYAIFLALFDLYLFILRPSAISWPITIFLSVSALSLALAPLTWPTDVRTFRLVIETELVTEGNGIGPFVTVESKLQNGNNLIREIDVLLFIEIANTLNRTRYVKGYSLEARTEDGWTPLCEADLRYESLYSVIKATTIGINLSSLLSLALKDKVEPEAPVSGWSAWECPDKQCSTFPLRLVIDDVDGTQERIPLGQTTKNGDKANQFLAKALMQGNKNATLDLRNSMLFDRRLCAEEIHDAR